MRRRLASPAAAAAILAAFWLMMQASLWDKSLTRDESGRAAAGATFWKYGDYRLDPETGILPQRLLALPFLFGGFVPPKTDSPYWQKADTDDLSYEWLYQTEGNDAAAMTRLGRAAAGGFAVALGAVTWLWSRRLFGPMGGLLSLLLFVLSPTVLGYGGLMTSDAAAAFFLLASTYGLWALLHRISAARLIGSALLIGGFFITKQSAILMVPVAAILVAARLISGRPLPVEILGRRELTRRGPQALALAAAAAFHALVAIAVVWAAYGFRYSAVNGPPLGHPAWDDSFTGIPVAPIVAQSIALLKAHRLLPEAYIHNCAYFFRQSHYNAFLNGDFSPTGWRWFFPYTFLVKTPLTVFGVMILALVAAAGSSSRSPKTLAAGTFRPTFYETLPLWTVFILYWASVIPSHMDIGHRYILPIYPALFVLCGAAGLWWEEAEAGGAANGAVLRRRQRRFGAALCALMALLAAEVFYRFPNYLAYFNGLVAPARAYRHLVDSSLDWGQDLPGLREYIARHPSPGRNYLSYFGLADRSYYKITADYLHSSTDTPWDAYHPPLPLQAGTYFISATMLQPVPYDFSTGPWGPWNQRYEDRYRDLRAAVRPLLQGDAATRAAALATRGEGDWMRLLGDYDTFRFARLTAYLRSREPDDTVNYSILVYHLTDGDLARALDGPPPELGPDLPALKMHR